MTSEAPTVNNRLGENPNKWMDPTVANIIATEVAKFLAMLSAYLMHTATDRPPIPYHNLNLKNERAIAFRALQQFDNRPMAEIVERATAA